MTESANLHVELVLVVDQPYSRIERGCALVPMLAALVVTSALHDGAGLQTNRRRLFYPLARVQGWRTQTQRPGLFPKGSVTAAPRKAKSSKACARKPKRARQEVFIECAGVTPLPQFQTLAEASARVHHASCHHLRHCRASRRAPRGACVGRGRVLRHVRHQPCQFPQVRQPPRLQRCARRLRAAAKPMRIPLCAF